MGPDPRSHGGRKVHRNDFSQVGAPGPTSIDTNGQVCCVSQYVDLFILLVAKDLIAQMCWAVCILCFHPYTSGSVQHVWQHFLTFAI